MRRASILPATLLGLSLAAGCLEPAEPVELAQGVNVLDAGDDSLAVAYRKDDLVIYMEALRGQPTPEPYQLDSNSPRYEVDARLVADDGRMFFLQRGGDHYVDADWADDMERQNRLAPTRESNRVLFDLATEAAASLGIEVEQQIGRDSALALVPELDALRLMGEQSAVTYAVMKDQLVEHIAEAGLPELAEIEYGSSAGPESPDVGYPGGYYWNVELHADDIDGSPAGYHSAVRINRWDGYWAFANDFANHGRAPYQDGMPVVCYAQWDAPVGPDNKPPWTAYTCNTGYALYSDDGGHNCHDDSRLLMASFVYGHGRHLDPGWSYWCNGADDDSDISVDIWGWELDHDGYPQCNASASMGWNHPHMCRQQNIHGYNGAAGCYCDAACVSYGDCCIDGPY